MIFQNIKYKLPKTLDAVILKIFKGRYHQNIFRKKKKKKENKKIRENGNNNK